MGIKSVRKYVTTDGVEFLSYETAQEHQRNIESIGGFSKGDIVYLLIDNYVGGSFGKVDKFVDGFLFFDSISHRNCASQIGPVHLSEVKAITLVSDETFRLITGESE